MIRRRSCSAALLLVLSAACQSPGSGSSSDAPGRSDASAPPSAPVPADAGSGAVTPLAPEYRGTIGQDGPIVARLFGSGDRVTGTYFRESDGIAHMLSGTAKGARLALDDTTDSSKSGSLFLDVAADGTVNGTWNDGHGEKPARVHLQAITPVSPFITALVFKRVIHAARPARDAKSKDETCTATVTYPEVYGLPASAEAKINADLAPSPELALAEKCEHSLEIAAEYRIAHNADGILSVRLTSSTTDGVAGTKTRGGRAVSVLLTSAAPVKLFGDVVKPKAERTFETALGEQVAALARKNNLDVNGRKALDQALAFSPPFVVEDRGVHLFADALPAPYSAAGAEGVVVRYATLPRPLGPVAVMWGK